MIHVDDLPRAGSAPAAASPGVAAWLAIAMLAAAGLVLPQPGLVAQLAFCAPLIAIFGVPHGATDWQVARSLLGPMLGRTWAMWFAAFYAVGMLLSASAAAAAPQLAMLAFVAVAVWHFGAEDAGAHGLDGKSAILAFGLPPIAAPALFWPNQTASVLHSLGVLQTGQDSAVAAIGAVAMLAWLGAAALAIRTAPGRRQTIIRECAALVCLQAAAPPLIAFTGYFCLIHGPRHMAALPRMAGAWAVPAATIVAVGLIGAAVCALAAWHGQAPSWAAANGIFWGLAALTAPHVAFGRLAASLAARGRAPVSPEGGPAFPLIMRA